MRALEIATDRSLRLVDVPDAELEPDQVQVAVAFCGICGSDLHMRDSPAIPEGAIMGHEFSGRVVALGAEVKGWQPGDRVCAFPFAPCGRCSHCAAGDEQLCAGIAATGLGLGVNPGAYAETVAVRHSMLRRLPDELADEHGALAEPLAVGLHAVSACTADVGEPVAVIGAGPIGAMTAISLRARGFERVVLVEPNERRRERAGALGFDAIGLQRVRAKAIAALGGDPPAVVFECAGQPAAPQLAIDLVAPAGQIVLLGVLEEPVSISQLTLLAKEAQIRTALAYRRREFDEAIELLAGGGVPAGELISRIVPLAEGPAMFEELTRPDTGQLKVLLRP
ncbi:MAG TPA: alcohol dehydrogenase catalytic domain-containing protein [Solirubrobacterales bacterium]